jgi:hypothetical protein
MRHGAGRSSLRSGLAGLLLVAGSGGLAVAQEHPSTFPTRDVDVIYRMAQYDAPGGARLLEQRMRYAVAARKLRVDPPSPGLYVIVDYAAHRLETIRDDQRMVMDVDAPGRMAGAMPGGPGAPSSAPFVRHGVAQVAGLNCTDWETKDASGQPALVCLTDDGVLLRAFGGGRVLLEAARVTYGSIDPAVFLIPDGYKHITPPPLSSAVPLASSPPSAGGSKP